MIAVGLQLRVKLIDRDADFVEIAPVTELNPARDHVDVETFHVVIGDIGSRVRNHGEATRSVVHTMLLPVYVVRFLRAEVAELSGDIKNRVRVIDVDVDFRLTFCTSQHNRVADVGKRLAQFAAVDVSRRYDALRAEPKS